MRGPRSAPGTLRAWNCSLAMGLSRSSFLVHCLEMEPRVVRPSLKIVSWWYGLAAIITVAGVFFYYHYLTDKPLWLMLIPAVIFIVPIRKHIETRLIKVTI